MEQDLTFEQIQTALIKACRGKLKSLVKTKGRCQRELEASQKWEEVHREGELLKSHLGALKRGSRSIQLEDWATGQKRTLALDPLKTPQEEMALRFRRAKKLQKGIQPLTEWGKRLQEEIDKAEKVLQKIESATSLADLPPDQQKERSPKKTCEKKTVPIYREYISKTGFKIWVGKNAKANDKLTFQLANGRDWWLHVCGCPGSHVIIRLEKEEKPDTETLQDAMQLALHYSKARSQGEGEVVLSQRKYVSKLARGKPGQVQISKRQTAWVKADSNRLESFNLHP